MLSDRLSGTTVGRHCCNPFVVLQLLNVITHAAILVCSSLNAGPSPQFTWVDC